MSDPQEPSAWEYDYQSPTGMGREVTLSPPWLADPDGARNGRPLFRSPSLTTEERDALEWASKTLCVGWHDLAPEDKQRTRDAADTLRGLLERLG